MLSVQRFDRNGTAEVSDAPGIDAAAVTKSDATVLNETRGIYVGGAGDVAVRMISGNSVTFVGVQAGTLLPIRVDKVLSTGTNATSIVAIY